MSRLPAGTVTATRNPVLAGAQGGATPPPRLAPSALPTTPALPWPPGEHPHPQAMADTPRTLPGQSALAPSHRAGGTAWRQHSLLTEPVTPLEQPGAAWPIGMLVNGFTFQKIEHGGGVGCFSQAREHLAES